MAQRNPLNERYKREGGGKTRKSAAKAKPKKEPATPTRGKQMKDLSAREQAERKREEKQIKRRMAADAQRNKTKEERKAEREKSYKERPPVVMPTSPEYKLWRKVWMGLLIAAVVAVAGSLLLQRFASTNRTLWSIVLSVSYLMIFLALLVDFIKLKPLRKKAQQEAYLATKSGKKRRELEKVDEDTSEEGTDPEKDKGESGPSKGRKKKNK